MASDYDKFQNIFTGLDRAYGIYNISQGKSSGAKVKGRAKTVMDPVITQLYKDHLDGKAGLGIIPIMDDSNCWFGAVDIDEYDLDLKKVEKEIRKMEAPAVLIRTKSGGAHVYIFGKELIPAKLIRQKLMELSAALGFADAEVFPKQIKLASQNDVGSWINLPYFNQKTTDRWAMNKGRKVSFKEFIKLVAEKATTPDELEEFDPVGEGDFADGPPCLQQLSRQGFPEGTRNSALFSVGVYVRAKYDDDWEERLGELNQQTMDPPLGYREVQQVIKNLNKKEYFYKCNDQPICNFCNRPLCMSRQFGIGPGGNEEIPYLLDGLTKIDSEIPTWTVGVNGDRVTLDTAHLMDQNRFRKICVERLNIFPPRIKPIAWEKMWADLLENVHIVEVSPDSGPRGTFLNLFQEFLNRPFGRVRDEILNGKVWKDEEEWHWFRKADLMAFLARRKFFMEDKYIVNILAQSEGQHQHRQHHIKGQTIWLWAVTNQFVNPQTESFDVPGNMPSTTEEEGTDESW